MMNIIRSPYQPYHIRLAKQFVGKLRSYNVFVFYPTRLSPKFGSPETTEQITDIILIQRRNDIKWRCTPLSDLLM